MVLQQKCTAILGHLVAGLVYFVIVRCYNLLDIHLPQNRVVRSTDVVENIGDVCYSGSHRRTYVPHLFRYCTLFVFCRPDTCVLFQSCFALHSLPDALSGTLLSWRLLLSFGIPSYYFDVCHRNPLDVGTQSAGQDAVRDNSPRCPSKPCAHLWRNGGWSRTGQAHSLAESSPIQCEGFHCS